MGPLLFTRPPMRFAYIDSNGKEIPIPSVDALALRIELGAITEETQLYDAQADQWGPAHTHEIFHTLSRSSGSDEGFVAPPPVAPQPAAESGPEDGDAANLVVDFELVPAKPEVREATEADGDFGLALADTASVEESPDDNGLGLGGLELAPPLAGAGGVGATPIDVAGLGDASAPDDDEPLAPAFDFGGLEGGLELEASFDPPDDGAMSPGSGFETAMEFDADGFGTDSTDGLDLETPMSAFTPEAPPAWMEPETSESDGDALDLSSESGTPASNEPEEHRARKSRPSPPKLRRQRSLAGPLTAVAVGVALAVGGYMAWPLLSERLGGSGSAGEPAVFLPPLDDALMPEMRSVAAGAFARAFADAHAGWASGGGVEVPPRDWLAGVYLGNASAYPGAADFWNGMGDWLDAVRVIDVSVFDAAFAAEATARGLVDADALRERADSGFVAAAADRGAAYARMDALVDAATRLHDFLAANEANLEHIPATSMTTDPVMEIRPASEQVRAALEDLLGSVTDALVALRYRDQVTAQGLQGHLLQMVQESGVR